MHIDWSSSAVFARITLLVGMAAMQPIEQRHPPLCCRRECEDLTFLGLDYCFVIVMCHTPFFVSWLNFYVAEKYFCWLYLKRNEGKKVIIIKLAHCARERHYLVFGRFGLFPHKAEPDFSRKQRKDMYPFLMKED